MLELQKLIFSQRRIIVILAIVAILAIIFCIRYARKAKKLEIEEATLKERLRRYENKDPWDRA